MPATFTYPSADGTPVTAYRWDPAARPRAIVQLTHGMGEHARRYEHVAQALTAAGYVVYAQDHRGHGATAAPGAAGQVGAAGWLALVDDVGRLAAEARSGHPGIPLVLLGHSMGSFAVQQYLLDHSADIDAVILTGTALLDLREPPRDDGQPRNLARPNDAFTPARTGYDWLSRDEAVVDAYIADPMCGFSIDGAARQQMYTSGLRFADPAALGQLRPELPVYVAVGDKDPVNAGLTRVTPLPERLTAAGLTDVTLVVYPGARHEVLNETNKDEVIAALIGWINRVTGP
jgi:alpha-beta hydrolase superfamily lysophospholipase